MTRKNQMLNRPKIRKKVSVVKKKEREITKGLIKSARRFFCCQRSSFLRRDHLQDEADDGVGGLVGVQLGEEVADVVGCASLLTRHEPKQPGDKKTKMEIYWQMLLNLRWNYIYY